MRLIGSIAFLVHWHGMWPGSKILVWKSHCSDLTCKHWSSDHKKCSFTDLPITVSCPEQNKENERYLCYNHLFVKFGYLFSLFYIHYPRKNVLFAQYLFICRCLKSNGRLTCPVSLMVLIISCTESQRLWFWTAPCSCLCFHPAPTVSVWVSQSQWSGTKAKCIVVWSVCIP